MCSDNIRPKTYLLFDILGRIIENRDMVSCVTSVWSRLFSGRHDIIELVIFSNSDKLREIFNMHF